MIDINQLFSIRNSAEFESAALEVFGFQAVSCPPYAEYVRLLGIKPQQVKTIREIPFLPVEIFKSHKVYCGGTEPQIVFTSSGTAGMVQSRHYVKNVSVYEQSFMEGFRYFYGAPDEYHIFALLPGYLEREGSSLIYMVERLIAQSGGGGFFLYDIDSLMEKLQNVPVGQKTLLIGVTFALLDFAENHTLDLSRAIVMETGGMKGRRKELSRGEVHEIVSRRFHAGRIHSEYGMCECLSQAYSSGNGLFSAPPWMKILVRDIHDPFEYVENGRTGAINIIDLANVHSCSFLQTQDAGVSYENETFGVLGRLDNSEIRGCNLLLAD